MLCQLQNFSVLRLIGRRGSPEESPGARGKGDGGGANMKMMHRSRVNQEPGEEVSGE